MRSCIWVFDSEAKLPPFAYSIGFTSSYDHAEVVVAGFAEELSGSVLSSVQSMLTDGRVYRDGDASGEILEGAEVRFRALSRDILISNLVQATVFYGEDSFDALQLLWPDRNGRFPEEEDAPVWLSDRQSLLP
ncbi:DUF4262 domain-containing protein [Isoptericola sediminis]|uniref:DUF4262 domain-containing protein n=1 Tax=Isoptericola sediminis TaxID=2733572 RepID=A0A849K565_9MICO|nr:DUF4262 domain-containing protein [Isoptericola sediminis]NNU26935.1 DUF4262 domain-containing protein [Isoptericola sediminis]